MLGLAPVTGGTIRYDGRDIAHLTRKERRALSSEIQVVFQDPYTSLNPSMTIEQILTEPLHRARRRRAGGARQRVRDLLDQVRPARPTPREPPAARVLRRPAAAHRDRPGARPATRSSSSATSRCRALDLSTQARVLDLFIEIQERTGVAYLFISHDLAVVRHISHRVAVMYRGEIVESGDGDQVTARPEHPYTQRLLHGRARARPRPAGGAAHRAPPS